VELVATLDRVRGRTYGALLRVPGTRAVVAHKERRLALLLALGALPALLFAIFLPSFSLVVAPLVLGVPHLAADLRYLVIKPRWPRALLWLLLAGSLAVLGLRGVELLTQRSLAGLEIAAAWLWCAAAAGLASRAPAWKLGITAALLSLIGVAGWSSPEVTRLAFGYAHNLVAIALWLTFFGGASRSAFLALGVVAVATLALLFGGSSFLPPAQALLGERLSPLGDMFAPASDWFALPSTGPGWGLGILTSFAFLQSVHYLLWLHVIPGQEVPGNRTRSFAQSWQFLQHDFGPAGLLFIAGLTAITLAGLFVAPGSARTAYTSLSTFHGYLELAIGLFAWLSVESRRESVRASPRSRAGSEA
jgi:hypothetical protein